MSYDLPFIFRCVGTADDVWIVDLDQLDGKRLDRRNQARLLDKLGKAGAKAVAYDLIFDWDSKDPAIDREFAEAIRRFRGVNQEGNPIPGAQQRHVFLACGHKAINETGMIGEQLIPPADALLDAADDFGWVA